MKLFKCSLDELAQKLSEKPELYIHATVFLRVSRELFSKQLDVDKTLATIEEANKIARESDYYVFAVEDTWTTNQGGLGEGFGVYQKTNDKLTEKLGMGTLSIPASLEETVAFFKKNKITQAFTAVVPSEGYCGLKDSLDKSDEETISYSRIDNDLIEYFKEEGVNITFLGLE